jgi:ribonuclease BN (tRNA processing enzyme)
LSEGVSVRVRCQEHSDPSIGLRLDNPSLAFITDTGCTDETVSFVAGCKTLFHDSFYDADDHNQLSVSDTGRGLLRDHGHALGVADIADRAAVEQAYLIHLSPQYSEERIERMQADARRLCPSVSVPSDLEALAT